MRRIRLIVVTLIVFSFFGLFLGHPHETYGAGKCTVMIAQQYGLWCAVNTIVVQKKLIEKYAPECSVTETRFASGADVRSALIAGRLEVGISGFAPFIKGWSKGAPTKTCDVMTSYKHELLTYHTDLKDIHGFVKLAKSKAGFKIACPAPGSSNHIALQWHLKNNGYDAKTLDIFVVKMKHPISYQSLVTKQVDAHITSPPFAVLEKEKGMKSLAGLWPNPGGWMPNAQVVVNTDWAKANPKIYQAVVKAYNEAAAWATKNPRKAAEIIAPTLKMSVEDTMKQLRTEARFDVSEYNIEEQLLRYSAFMHEVGLIKRMPKKLSDFAMPELVKAGH